jgi:hypothetical protein
MGLLDDAIREHLDLKRRRGADPSEVERAEREALGPVRRNPTPAELAEADAAAAPGGALAYDQAGEESYPTGGESYPAGDEDWSHDSLQEPPADAGAPLHYDDAPPEPVRAAEFPAPAPAPLHDAHDPLAEEPFEDEDGEEAFETEPRHAPVPVTPAPPSMGAGPETAEYNVEDALAAEEGHERGGEDEDVLEETPEFLQDTPDHDRLWFEQRPPKDFDFDE